jgi:hypothetical protein
MRFFAFVVDRGSFACEALFQNINGFPASRRVVHLLRSEKGAGAQHPPEIAAARDLYQSYHNAEGRQKMPPDIKWTNFFITEGALTLECGIRRIIATFLCESDTSMS